MGKYYLAVDIGASSGRHILGRIENGKMELEEIYRFENGMNKDGDHLIWDVERLGKEIVNGIAKCKEIGKTYGYRDIRTKGTDEEVYKINYRHSRESASLFQCRP